MKINVKAPLVAAALGLGFITAAHAAQQPSPASQAGAGQQAPMKQMPMMQGERPMMNGQQMRGQMSTMMQGCRKMMDGKGNRSAQSSLAR